MNFYRFPLAWLARMEVPKEVHEFTESNKAGAEPTFSSGFFGEEMDQLFALAFCDESFYLCGCFVSAESPGVASLSYSDMMPY